MPRRLTRSAHRNRNRAAYDRVRRGLHGAAVAVPLVLAACAGDDAAVLDRVAAPTTASTTAAGTIPPASPVTTDGTTAPPDTSDATAPSTSAGAVSYRFTSEQLDAAAVHAADLDGAAPGDDSGPVLFYPCTDTPLFGDMTTSPGGDVRAADGVRIGTRVAVTADASTTWADQRLTAKSGCTFTHADGVEERVDQVTLDVDEPASSLHGWGVLTSYSLPGKGRVIAQSLYVQKGRLVGVTQCIFALSSSADDVARCGTAHRILGAHMVALLRS